MKKRLIPLLLFVFLLAVCAPALAEPQMSISAGPITLYIGPDGGIYEAGINEPLCATPASDLVYADSAKLLFVTADGNELMDLALGDGDAEPKSIATTTMGSVYVPRDGLAYYVSLDDDTALMGFDPVGAKASKRATMATDALALSATAEGLVLTLGGGDMLFVPQTGTFIDAPWADAEVRATADGRFETLLTADGALSLRTAAQPDGESAPIDTSVAAVTSLHGLVYYLKTTADGAALMSYDYATQSSALLSSFQSTLLPTMSAAGENIYLVGHDGRVFSMDVDSHTVNTFGEIEPMPTDVALYAADDRLFIYDTASGSQIPQYLMTMTHPDVEVPEVEPAPPEIAAEPAPELPEPPQPENLSKGSRGDDVRELQQILHSHGYPVGKPDGIYGNGTVNAVKYLQSDEGLKQTGVVTPSFMERIRNGKLPQYEAYVELERGDSGIRVTKLQQQLRALRYMDAKADGIYGHDTEAAVKLFEKALSEKESGVATAHMQKQLFSKNAPNASTIYSDIAPKPTAKPAHPASGSAQKVSEDDLITMTRWMNNKFDGQNLNKAKAIYKVQSRLCKLGYLKKSQRSKVYDATTVKAMKHFQDNNDPVNKPSGIPTTHTLELLFPERMF